jgi:SP family general alpha glucoside:H+ symporter-like MFS transporter
LESSGTIISGCRLISSTLACAYASEITPLVLRPYLTGWICTCWVVGIFIGNGLVNGTLVIPGEWAFRSAFATQWVWPIPLIIGMYFAPESPWWLVRHNRLEEAEKSVKRLAVKEMRDRSHLTVAQMVRTNQFEIDVARSQQATSPTWRDLLRGVDLRRTEIACMTFAAHNLCGDPFAGEVLTICLCLRLGNIVYFFPTGRY